MKGFVMLPSYYEAIRPLPDKERLALYDAVMDYAFSGKEPKELSPILDGFFSLLRPNIDSSIKRYTSSVENGRKGGRPPKDHSNKPSDNPAGTKSKPDANQDKEREKELEKELEKEKEKEADKPPTRSKRFVPPTVNEVAVYVQERGSAVDPQAFIDFYESKGWMVGRSPMRDWRAACRNAEKWGRWRQKGDTREEIKTAADYDGESFVGR